MTAASEEVAAAATNTGNGETANDLQEPLLQSTSANTTTAANSSDNDNDESKNITIQLPCCPHRKFSMNHNVFLNLLLCVLYGVSDSLWAGTVNAAYLKRLGHARNTWVGNVQAAGGLAGLFSALPVGFLADKLGRDVVLRWGGVMLVVTAMLHALLLERIGTDENHPGVKHSEVLLGLIMALWGVGGGIVNGPSQALFADSTPNGKRSDYFTYLFVCYMVASCLGPLVSIILFQTLGDDWDLYDLRVIIYVGLALECFNGSVMLFFDDSKALEEEGENSNQEEHPLLENGQQQQQSTTTSADEEQPAATTEAATNNQTNTQDDTLKKRQAWIPYILFTHSLVFSLGSGMTVKFFPLFFKDQVGMSPTQVQIVYLIVPLAMAACSGLGTFIAKQGRLGRVPTGLLFKLLGVSGLFSMVLFKNYLDRHPLLLVPIYVARTALMNAVYPLEESVLMDFVPKQERARWKSLESISIFGWCGSAALGGWASDHANGDYTFTFLITACIQVVGCLIWATLLPIVPLHEGEDGNGSNNNGTGQTQQSSSSSYRAPGASSANQDAANIEELAQQFPSLTVTDCARFYEEFEGDDLRQKLQEYVEFRQIYNLDELRDATTGGASDLMLDQPMDDAADWKWASDLAIRTARTRQEPLVPGVPGQALSERVCKWDELPQICFAPRHEDGTVVCSVDGNPILSYTAARLDLDEVSPEVHALAIALYLERKAYTHSFDTKGAVLLVDTRKGAGWANHRVFAIIGFLQMLASTLYKTHPGRVEKFIFYPVPPVGAYAFKMMKGWLPGEVADTITMIKGSDGINSPPPKEELAPYVTEEVLNKLEETRRSHFIST